MKQKIKIKGQKDQQINHQLISVLKEIAQSSDEQVNIHHNEDGSLDVYGASGIVMHKFVTECELQGKKFDYEKQTTYLIS